MEEKSKIRGYMAGGYKTKKETVDYLRVSLGGIL